MPFDDLNDEDSEETNPGDEALDELAGTLSGDEDRDEETADDDTSDDSDAMNSRPSEYDMESEPAFPTVKHQTQHSVYCLPRTWDTIDGASGLLFEAEVTLRRDGYDAVQKRELHNAFLQAAAQELTADDVAAAFVAMREEREDGPLLEE